MSEEMLNRWANTSADRNTIEEFWEWLLLNAENSKFALGNPDVSRIPLLDIHIHKALDEFHKIDRKQLDDERRQLLESL